MQILLQENNSASDAVGQVQGSEGDHEDVDLMCDDDNCRSLTGGKESLRVK
jgi:hypothetical protein